MTRRRDALGLLGGGLLARLLPGCDRLVVVSSDRRTTLEPITANEDHYVYTVFPVPDVDPETHVTRVLAGGVEVARFDLAAVEALVARDKEHTLQCIGGGPFNLAIGNAIWSGLPLSEVLDALGVSVPASAVGLRLVGADRNDTTGEHYSAGVPVEDLVDGPIWLVWRMNGEPVPKAHGGPYRLLVPNRYGMKNLKWPIEIAFVDVPHVSYWTPFGWSEPAPYQANTFVIQPSDQIEVDAGSRIRFAGSAFAGSDPIEAVEVSLDGGPWTPAMLDYEAGPDIWVLWSFDWTATRGEHRLQARCTAASGARSEGNPNGTNHLDGYDGSMQIVVFAR